MQTRLGRVRRRSPSLSLHFTRHKHNATKEGMPRGVQATTTNPRTQTIRGAVGMNGIIRPLPPADAARLHAAGSCITSFSEACKALVRNALASNPSRVQISIAQSAWRVRVEDDGGGIPPHVMPWVGEVPLAIFAGSNGGCGSDQTARSDGPVSQRIDNALGGTALGTVRVARGGADDMLRVAQSLHALCHVADVTIVTGSMHERDARATVCKHTKRVAYGRSEADCSQQLQRGTVACAPAHSGTAVTAEGVFRNIPVRQRSMAAHAEMQNFLEWLARVALIHAQVQIAVIDVDARKVVFAVRACAVTEQRVQQVLPRVRLIPLASGATLMPVYTTCSRTGMLVQGFLGAHTHPTDNIVRLYTNGEPVCRTEEAVMSLSGGHAVGTERSVGAPTNLVTHIVDACEAATVQAATARGLVLPRVAFTVLLDVLMPPAQAREAHHVSHVDAVCNNVHIVAETVTAAVQSAVHNVWQAWSPRADATDSTSLVVSTRPHAAGDAQAVQNDSLAQTVHVYVKQTREGGTSPTMQRGGDGTHATATGTPTANGGTQHETLTMRVSRADTPCEGMRTPSAPHARGRSVTPRAGSNHTPVPAHLLFGCTAAPGTCAASPSPRHRPDATQAAQCAAVADRVGSPRSHVLPKITANATPWRMPGRALLAVGTVSDAVTRLQRVRGTSPGAASPSTRMFIAHTRGSMLAEALGIAVPPQHATLAAASAVLQPPPGCLKRASSGLIANPLPLANRGDTLHAASAASALAARVRTQGGRAPTWSCCASLRQSTGGQEPCTATGGCGVSSTTGGTKLRRSMLMNLHVVGQVDKKFLVATQEVGRCPRQETDMSMHTGGTAVPNASPIFNVLLFDQHAVDERLRLEKMTRILFGACALDAFDCPTRFAHRPLRESPIALDGLSFKAACGIHEAQCAYDVSAHFGRAYLSPAATLLLEPHVAHAVTQFAPVADVWGWQVRSTASGSIAVDTLPHFLDVNLSLDDLLQFVVDVAAQPYRWGSLKASLVARGEKQSTCTYAGDNAAASPTDLAAAAESAERIPWMCACFRAGLVPPAIMRVLHSKSCRGAIMFGDAVSRGVAERMLRELAACELPFQCAHGRPAAMPLARLHSLL
ncbi:hypothetical protein EON66_00055 [archaeon]|nr:MAG: hypothetical protein EON66_00055 [archaeon]